MELQWYGESQGTSPAQEVSFPAPTLRTMPHKVGISGGKGAPQAGSLLPVPAPLPVDAAPPLLLTGQLVQACFAQVLGHRAQWTSCRRGSHILPGGSGCLSASEVLTRPAGWTIFNFEELCISPFFVGSADKACRADPF